MAVRANKITIRVTPSRHQQTMSIHATGKFGKTLLSYAPIYVKGQTLSPAASRQAYWTAVLVAAQAQIASTP